MKILVISDTHGDPLRMKSILENNSWDNLIHLGDGERDFAFCESIFPQKPMVYVGGNCDYGRHEDSHIMTVCGVKIFCAHGHKFNVRSETGKELLAAEAAKNGCTAALYGHTHICDIRTVNGVLLMNPGSPSLPRGGNPPSFGILSVTEKGEVIPEIIDLEGSDYE